ncbi:MAG: tetratricopeptide repeat protein [Desulfobacteraceae bacterium]|jgi:tetratricopeptide (TPR) repeat protein
MRTLILTIIFTILFLPSISAQSENVHELGLKGIELTHDMQYEKADKIFDEMIRLEPENARGYFFKSACYYSSYTDENKHAERFKDATNKAIDIARVMLQKNGDDPDAMFYLGGAYGKLGMYYLDNRKYIKAYWYGTKGIKYLKKVIEKDPDYYDAYLGLGIYNYSVSVLPKMIRSLSFLLRINEDREKGLDQIRLTSSKGIYAKDDAKIALINIYLDYENDFDAALQLLKGMVAKYPYNPINKESLARCYRKLKKHDLSVQTLKAALQAESIVKFPFMHSRLYFDLGKTYSESNEYDQAVPAFENALKISKSKIGKNASMKSWSLFYIGDCYEMTGSVDKARECYLKIKKKDNKTAFKYAKGRIENPLTPVRIKFTRGKNCRLSGKYNQAYAIFNDLLKSELNIKSLDKTFIAEFNYNLGAVEYYLKKYQNAIQSLQEVLTINGIKEDWIKPWTHYYLGNCYREMNETEKAKKEYDIAYKFDDVAFLHKVEKVRRK